MAFPGRATDRNFGMGLATQWQDAGVTTPRIAVVGDYADTASHRATDSAIAHSGAARGLTPRVEWIPTPDLAHGAEHTLREFDGVWIAPGSPYESMPGALAAICVARTTALPLIGTCGGFQHVVIEYARNVLGFSDAEHAEYDPTASQLFITALECSLAGMTMAVRLHSGTLAATAYRAAETTESYYCRFGLNADYLGALENGGLSVSGVDQDGEVRVIELPTHPFFIATLFVPQMASTDQSPHPLVSAFVAACANATIVRP
jgi:CTP synthase (UTP-ammonia lyase)